MFSFCLLSGVPNVLSMRYHDVCRKWYEGTSFQGVRKYYPNCKMVLAIGVFLTYAWFLEIAMSEKVRVTLYLLKRTKELLDREVAAQEKNPRPGMSGSMSSLVDIMVEEKYGKK